MLAIGIRELKAKLGEYVQRVKSGEVVLVTERGVVVAELRAPISVTGLPPELVGLANAVERGEVTIGLPGRGAYPASPLHLAAGTARSILDEERSERR